MAIFGSSFAVFLIKFGQENMNQYLTGTDFGDQNDKINGQIL